MTATRPLPPKAAKALGWQLPPPATMTRATVIDYLGGRTIYDDVIASGWLMPCGRKVAKRSQTGEGRGDTILFATSDVIKASERMAREGYPPVSARKAKSTEGDEG